MSQILRRSGRAPGAGVLKGCLVVLVIVVILGVIGAIFVARNWKGWIAQGAEALATTVVNESQLPQDQKDSIVSEVRKLGDDFKAGRISTEDLQRVVEAIAESPLIPLAGVQAARQNYVDPSDMTPEEKASANRALQRFARGIHEKKIAPAEEAVTETIKPIVRLKPGNQWEFKDNPTRLEVDQFIANAKARADDAQIPDEPFDLNIADELKKAIDRALGRAPAP